MAEADDVSAPGELLLAYYGDDFTGSTDALESLTRAGLRTALFLEPPTSDRLAARPELQAIGVAGLTRSLEPLAMEATLRPAFAALRGLGPRHVHYKVCSTFDSSPTVGSIGRAIEVGADVFGGRYVPLLVAAPALGRHCVFGNLFARSGIGSDGAIHRLDRHPTMSQHPVTPADEADLRMHLSRQTNRRIGLIDVLQWTRPADSDAEALEQELAKGAEIVLFDALHASSLARIGALLDAEAARSRPVFSVGSSGIDMALGAHWSIAAGAAPRTNWQQPGAVEKLLVISGSCSPVTAGQIDWATANGFAAVKLDPRAPNMEAATAEAKRALGAGQSVVVFSSRGKAEGGMVPASQLGAALGGIAREVLAEARTKRLAIAGGDSSSYAARALGIEAVEMIAPLAPGAPLCRAQASDSPAGGLEICFKGGQVGAPDFFGAVRRGQP